MLASLVVGCGPIEDPNYPHAAQPPDVEIAPPAPAPSPPTMPPTVGPPASPVVTRSETRSAEESFSLTLSERGVEERVAVEVDRTTGLCSVEAQGAGAAAAKVQLDAGSCEPLFALLQAQNGSWGAASLDCAGCGRVSGKHWWKLPGGRGVKVATFPRDLRSQDAASPLYYEMGRLGRRAGASLSLFP